LRLVTLFCRSTRRNWLILRERINVRGVGHRIDNFPIDRIGLLTERVDREEADNGAHKDEQD